jgi:hypothetical protein
MRQAVSNFEPLQICLTYSQSRDMETAFIDKTNCGGTHGRCFAEEATLLISLSYLGNQTHSIVLHRKYSRSGNAVYSPEKLTINLILQLNIDWYNKIIFSGCK